MSAEDKREARRKRILERGGDRLSRITHTGRGEGYVGLDATPVQVPKHNDSPEAEPKALAEAARTAAAAPAGADANVTKRSGDPFAEMMAAMQGKSAGTQDPMALMQELLGRTAGAASDPHAMPSVPDVPAATLRRAERLDRRMRLVQSTIVLLFSLYIVFGSIFSEAPPGILGRLFPTAAAVQAHEAHTYRRQWAALAQHFVPISEWISVEDPSVFPWGALRSPLDALHPSLGAALHPANLPRWPVFWVFFTMEVALVGMRIAVQQQLPAAPPTGLGSVVRLWAPALVEFVTPLLSAVSVASALVDDLCILLFAIGAGVLFCQLFG
ncbi:hypothetical protein MBRA1_003847 [Malassezia brasiliensis]|uniref:Transmembrane protein n=1 Tax=Malassezia brasiliensis TaxID=1821822 RepID=A0AAF0DYC3_9BASI|nr:hypothetical protein MBRA1_003847 [Malassezia brasiliensis]